MDEISSDAIARPAKAPSMKRRRWFGQVPPHVRARLDEEAGVLTRRKGIPFIEPASARRLDAEAQQRFLERQVQQRLDDEKNPIPF